jgi:hypothetical protein
MLRVSVAHITDTTFAVYLSRNYKLNIKSVLGHNFHITCNFAKLIPSGIGLAMSYVYRKQRSQ